MTGHYTTTLREIVELVLSRWPPRISLAESTLEPLARRLEFARLFEDRLEVEIERGLGQLAAQANWLIYAAAAKLISTKPFLDRSEIEVDEVVERLDRLIVIHGFPQLEGLQAVDGSFDLIELRALRMGSSGSGSP